jgi:hypothetical protein
MADDSSWTRCPACGQVRAALGRQGAVSHQQRQDDLAQFLRRLAARSSQGGPFSAAHQALPALRPAQEDTDHA